ncbi:HNH endonuclease [Pseudoalteromonas sp. SWYJZ19]|uniref:HNH endonuclease n=1 Tax=Pseudoalteromonas sp. SWYJZ19 TaxID=2792068 RepID=UPI0018CEA62B|nr:HNH endonuclease [Pseudoalteromonas sp. SWYJZ19]MBH0051937.1 HNH endonuclease [Pseudoalteromonas sp. SWYJZ19]
MIYGDFKEYIKGRDNSIRFTFLNGYGKHKKKIVITTFKLEPVAEVYLNDNIFMLIDACDLRLLESNPYIAHKRNDGKLCGRANGSSREYIHRTILRFRLSEKYQVDHINHNPLDNRVSNLRECSAQQNNISKRNSRVNGIVNTGFYGVVHVNELYDHQPAVYKVRHPLHGTYEKTFSCDCEAAQYRDKVISEYFLGEYNEGEWPTMNFIQWNHDTRSNMLIEEEAIEYDCCMREASQEALEYSFIWLNKHSWAEPFLQRYYEKYGFYKDGDDE